MEFTTNPNVAKSSTNLALYPDGHYDMRIQLGWEDIQKIFRFICYDYNSMDDEQKACLDELVSQRKDHTIVPFSFD